MFYFIFPMKLTTDKNGGAGDKPGNGSLLAVW